jgi:multiple sugar transport system permease protein
VTPVAQKRRLFLGGAAFALLAIACAAALYTALSAVTAAERDLLAAEARIAVGTLRETQQPALLDGVFPDRWRLSDEVDPWLDESVVYQAGDGLAARAALYDADSWYQVGTLLLSARRGSEARIPVANSAALFTLLGSLLLGLLLWVKLPVIRERRAAAVIGFLVATTVIVSLTSSLWLARNWATARLQEATDHRVAVAAHALRLVPDLGDLTGRPGGVAQLTGLAFVLRGSAGDVESPLLSAPVARALAMTDRPSDGRITVDGVGYAVADVGAVRLVGLPYEHAGGPTTTMVAVALIGLSLAAPLLSLAGLAERPRAFRSNLVAWSFLAPSLVHLLIFTIGPLAFAAWLSLHRWSLIDAARPFIGLANYVSLLGDGMFWNAIRNTAVFTFHVPASMALALGIALVVRRKVAGVVFLRAMLFLPTITSLVAIAMVWQWMLHDDYGLINWLLSVLGLPAVGWLSSPNTALLSIMIMAVWMVVGYQMILFQAGLATIPTELYDAARIDGAGPLQRFFHVTIPGLRHTLFFVLITSVIGSFQVFGAVYVMTEGGPLHATDVAVFHIYQEAWEFFRFGNAAAMSWVLFAIIFVVTWLQFRTLEQRLKVSR